MHDGEVAFVIVSWNSGEGIDIALASLEHQSAGVATLVVVDNASEDGTPERVRSGHPGVRLIEAGANLGFPAAANLGIAAALADPACRYVGLLNDDAWLDGNWLAAILNFAECHPEGAGFQGRTLDGRDSDVVDSFGLYIGRAGRAIQMGYRARGLHLSSREVFGVNAAAALYRRAFLDAQPFGCEYLDADLEMYLEDVDLAARSVVMGWRNYFVANATAYHLGSGGGREDRPTTLRLNSRNELLVAVKNLPWAILVRTVPGWVHAELARYGSLVRAGEAARIGSVFRGRLEGLASMPKFLLKRRVLAPHRAASSKRLWNLMDGASSVSS